MFIPLFSKLANLLALVQLRMETFRGKGGGNDGNSAVGGGISTSDPGIPVMPSQHALSGQIGDSGSCSQSALPLSKTYSLLFINKVL